MNANSFMRIEALGRDNYDTWKLQMHALLIKNDVWGERRNHKAWTHGKQHNVCSSSLEI